MPISILRYILLGIFVLVLAAIAIIFASLDSDSFAALEARFDVSDAVLSTIILVLIAIIPMRKVD